MCYAITFNGYNNTTFWPHEKFCVNDYGCPLFFSISKQQNFIDSSKMCVCVCVYKYVYIIINPLWTCRIKYTYQTHGDNLFTIVFDNVYHLLGTIIPRYNSLSDTFYRITFFTDRARWNSFQVLAGEGKLFSQQF